MMNAELKRSGHPILAAVLTVSIGPFAQAEPPEPVAAIPSVKSEELELLKEEETVSIASRYDQPISETPSNVYVITDEDIRHSGAVDLPTILRRIPGMEVMQVTGADFNVSARGNNQLLANRMLVLVDGRSIYVDAQGVVYWKAIPVTLPEIKRIEVLLGPASSIYGFNAFDGVVNIITKSPKEMQGTTVQFGGGEFGTITSAAIQAGTIGKFGYRLSIGRDQNQQWRDPDALAFRSHKFNVQTEYALSSMSKLSVSGGLVDSNRFDGPIPPSGTTLNASTPALGYAHAVYERPNFFVRAFWNRWDDTVQLLPHPFLSGFLSFTDRAFNPILGFRADTYNIEAQHAVDLRADNRLTYGINYRYNTLSGNLYPASSHENRLGFYVQDEYRATDRLTLNVGARYDLDTFISPTFSPRMALLYRAARDHTFRVGMSIAYRPPTLNETHFDARAQTTLPPPFPSPPVESVQGSSSLSPEQIVSYEAGYLGWLFRHRLAVRANVFFNHISDLIISTSPRPAQSGEADIYGGEVGADFLATRWLSGFVNVVYQEVGQTFTGDARRAVPQWKVNAGLRGEWENGLSAEVLYHHYGSVTYPINQAFSAFVPFGAPPVDPRVGSYNLLNMRAGYRFWQQKAAAGYMRDAEVAVSVFNALDDEHKEHPLGDLISRRVMGWVTMRF